MNRKWFLKTALLMIAAIGLVFMACGGNSPSDNPYSYTVTFNNNGGNTNANPAAITVNEPATTVGTLPATEPTKDPFDFDGWYTAASGGTEFTAATTVSGNITVYAHWKANTDLAKFQGVWKGTYHDGATTGDAEYVFTGNNYYYTSYTNDDPDLTYYEKGTFTIVEESTTFVMHMTHLKEGSDDWTEESWDGDIIYTFNGDATTVGLVCASWPVIDGTWTKD
ncbi:MAG: InlB B-repeat-containing protein [Treponema sp.]|jgi:uncharacterized repeat protein (TIGR02543 family)|nr:InlB B-repeat-containing protein [Treponema sp.]